MSFDDLCRHFDCCMRQTYAAIGYNMGPDVEPVDLLPLTEHLKAVRHETEEDRRAMAQVSMMMTENVVWAFRGDTIVAVRAADIPQVTTDKLEVGQYYRPAGTDLFGVKVVSVTHTPSSRFPGTLLNVNVEWDDGSNWPWAERGPFYAASLLWDQLSLALEVDVPAVPRLVQQGGSYGMRCETCNVYYEYAGSDSPGYDTKTGTLTCSGCRLNQ